MIDSVFTPLCQEIDNQNFLTDRTGVKIVELIAPRIELDPAQKILHYNGRKTPEKYCRDEVAWYDSMSLHVEDIPNKTPEIWKHVSDKDGKINSNYGWCIYSGDNYFQYHHALRTLLNEKDSRRSAMLYTRPSMQADYKNNGMSDFMCTYATQHFIRNNKLVWVVMMRSQDAIFGFFNDFYWQCVVYERFYNDLKKDYPDLEYGKIVWIANSFHLYERHFDMAQQIIQTERIAL